MKHLLIFFFGPIFPFRCVYLMSVLYTYFRDLDQCPGVLCNLTIAITVAKPSYQQICSSPLILIS